jgi:DNA polymerase III subunit epsilon
MTRMVLLDTETTGLEPDLGHRIIEVAVLELLNDLPTDRHFHRLIDPGREVSSEATRVHGITSAQVAGKPRFADIAAALLDFIGDSTLVAHNAEFDLAFLNTELRLFGLPPLDPSRVIDTLALAKARFPGQPNSLDALCRRFSIDLSGRSRHNALLDCRLLAEVYLELMGGRQRDLALAIAAKQAPLVSYSHSGSRTPRYVTPTAAEIAAHATFVARLKAPIWLSA